ncbi:MULTISPECIES: fumarylacetoacetase [unclassified Cupriavidus]|uniref:fumarylacetoacetase n=1 Tax=unclassified Cupriavidus TaxID=2640874 RepID=UPI003F919CEB
MILNPTHNASVQSWVESANTPDTDFPIQNLPFCVFRLHGSSAPARCGVAVGDRIVDVTRAASAFSDAALEVVRACADDTLNQVMQRPETALSAFRLQLFQLLALDAPATRRIIEDALVPMAAAALQMPVRIGGYTDFFASIHHATNAGRLFRPDQPLLPNYKYVPVGYNGRAASVQLGDAPVRRPRGQLRSQSSDTPAFRPCEKLDYEVELGFFVGRSSEQGLPVPTDKAWEHVFGVCLLNDWSARDMQAWEAQPLGPFLSKSFATSISPWVVTAEALAPFRAPAAPRPPVDPVPLKHLLSAEDQAAGAVQILIDARISTEQMRADGMPPALLSRSDSAMLYWTPAQMLAHHTSNGSALYTGDLIGSGTISGPDEASMGSLLEISRGGSVPLRLPSGEERRFLENGDEITFTARCERPGFASIGFGECRSTVLPSLMLGTEI